MDVRILIIGCGSIGHRHLQNLISLGIKNISIYDIDSRISENIVQEYGLRAWDSLVGAFKESPNIVIIAIPNHLHVEFALEAAKNCCHIFIEKPLSHNLHRVNELIKIIKKKDLITFVGCNMRFHPGPKKIKELIDKGTIGKVFGLRIQAGSYLPEWRPRQNYKKSYSALMAQGGGCILDCIHEIDLAFWYLGEIQELYCYAKNMDALGIETEEMAEILCLFKSDALGNIHLNYIQRNYERNCQIIGEKGTIYWSFNEGKVLLYDGNTKKMRNYYHPRGYEINKMYVDELKYFIDCVHKNKDTFNDIKQAAKVLEIAIAAKKSKDNKKVVRLD